MLRSSIPSCSPSFLLPVLVFWGALALYTLTVAPDVLGHDSGEFQFVPYILGIPHHTGYPLYVLLGKLWTLLPLGTVALRMNLFSALFGAGTVALTYLIGYELTRARGPAFLAALALALSPLFWQWSTMAGVRSANAFLMAAALYLALRWRHHHRLWRSNGGPQERSWSRWLLVLAAFVLGVGLAHHRSALFAIPALLLFVALEDSRALREGRLWLRSSLAFLLPLLSYLYLPVRAAMRPPFDQFDPSTWEGFSGLVGGVGVSAALLARTPDEVIQKAGLLGQVLPGELGPWGVVLSLGGLVWLLARDGRSFALLGITAGLVFSFVLLWNTGHPFRFNLPSLLPGLVVLAVGVALGAHLLITVLRKAFRPLSSWAPAVVPFLLALPVLWLGVQTYRGRLEAAARPLDGFREELRSGFQARRLGVIGFPRLEPEALLVAQWEQATVFWYLQLVEGINPGVTVRYPVSQLKDLLREAGGRPVYAAVAAPELVGRPLDMEGALVRVQPPPSRTPPPAITPVRMRFGDEIQLEGYRLWDRKGEPARLPTAWGDVLALSLSWRALRQAQGDYSVSVRIVNSAGHLVAQQDHRHPVLGLSPTSSWEPGQVISDYYELPLTGLGPGPHRLEVVLYTRTPQGFHNLPVTDASETPRGTSAVLVPALTVP